MHKFLKFIFGIKLYMFQTVPVSEKCSVLFQKYKFEKLVHLVGLIIRIELHIHGICNMSSVENN